MQEVVGSTPILSTKAHNGGLFSFMPFVVYIIYSPSLNQYYVGHTENITDRLYRHNHSGSKATKKAKDWVLKYTETFPVRSAAMKREQEIKGKKSRKYIEYLVSSAG